MDENVPDGGWHRVAGTGDLEDGDAVPVELMGLQLALYRVEGAWSRRWSRPAWREAAPNIPSEARSMSLV